MTTIAQAVEAASEAPVSAADAEPAQTRAHQHLEALVTIAEHYLAGTGDPAAARGRPRPRLYATMDLTALRGMELATAARVLAPAATRAIALSPLGSQTLACDAEVVAALFDAGRPVAISSPKGLPDKVCEAVLIRDGGCRFPGCRAPMAFCDVHHLRPGDHHPDLLVSVCRRCHRAQHARPWRVRVLPDDRIEFGYRRQVYVTQPRARAPARE